MHKDHRKHTKDRFLAEGLDSFEPHEILELLLFIRFRKGIQTALRTS